MKIIIITRDGEYNGSTAMEHYSKETPKEGEFLTDYITNYFRTLLTKDRTIFRRIPILSRMISDADLDKYEDEWFEKANSLEQSNGDHESYTQKYWSDKFTNIIHPALQEMLTQPKDDPQYDIKKPYVNFNINEKEIYFVFLNRIFDQFTDNDYHKYNSLIEKDRFGFIKAICQDCEILDETGNLKTADGGNYLYIHDKEWGCDGEKLVKFGNDWREDITNAKLKELLEKCFSKIIVFQHTSSSYHKSIKDLTFTSAADIEDIILKRGYF